MPHSHLRSFDYRLRMIVNDLSKQVLGHELVGIALPIAEYTGEKIGLQYLLAQTNQDLLPDAVSQDDTQIEEEFVEEKADKEENDGVNTTIPSTAEDMAYADLESAQLTLQPSIATEQQVQVVLPTLIK